MITEMIIVFVIAIIIFLILSVFMVDENPWLSIPFIMMGMIFSVLCAYEFWNFEWLYTAYNSTEGNTTAYIYSTTDYGNPYSYVFMLIFFIFFILFIYAGFRTWKEASETENEMDYRTQDKRWK